MLKRLRIQMTEWANWKFSLRLGGDHSVHLSYVPAGESFLDSKLRRAADPASDTPPAPTLLLAKSFHVHCVARISRIVVRRQNLLRLRFVFPGLAFALQFIQCIR